MRASGFKRILGLLRRPFPKSGVAGKITLTFAASAILTGVLSQFDLHGIESTLFDLRVRSGPQASPDDRIVLITIRDSTLVSLQDMAPLSLEWHARFLEALESYEPRAIGYLANLTRASQLQSQRLRPEFSRRILGAVERLSERSIPFVVGTPFDVTGEIVPPYPLGAIPHGVALVHKDGNVFARDKVTRRALLSLYGQPGFHLLLARSSGLAAADYRPSGTFELDEIEASYFYFRYHGDPSRSNYREIAFEDVLDGTIPSAELKGRILLVATATREDSSNFAFTPYSSAPYATSKAAIHANILDSILRNDGLIRPAPWVRTVSTFATTTAVLGVVLRSTPLMGVVASAGMMAALWLTSLLIFGSGSSSGIWLEVAHPSMGILLGYYLAVPYRLTREYRKRWEYQRKNQILLQVEELKTNFLSLVTHDLKTPVARIQGLAEMILLKGGNRLTDSDRQGLNHMIASTEELNRFISSILELAKIESSRLRPRLESKDVNQLVERCCESFLPFAKARGSTIELDLEPLFPIRLDPSLIQKVLNNLVDNALKYSPPNSTIRITTRERNEWLEIQVIDQGIGMSEGELENLFSKFYRAKNDATARIGGSGLGLYLSRYFIEAHWGELSVSSRTGEGSTFTIRLRADLAQSHDFDAPRGATPGLKGPKNSIWKQAQGEVS